MVLALKASRNYILKTGKTNADACAMPLALVRFFMKKLSDATMWQALLDCDPSYDGQFFYAVKTVGAYCRPSCKSRTPLRKNVSYFQTTTEAEQAGLRPCKRCRPDLEKYDPAARLAGQARELIDCHFNKRDRLQAELKHLGISQSHLAVVFRQHYGLTPVQYLGHVRKRQACALLEKTNMLITDIASAIGFESLASFYAFFKKQTGTSPAKFRQQAQRAVIAD
ncbi:Ada metal-binding domain-containing protein [Desulfovibrio sp.]|uniref:bifunctional transcriptional activator/DNA repair enzyme AdaA n=1 Tax=Desulfovibrio sp. TaxID=885 RepID=UPI0025C6CBBC|nr:Ada metal-binding domain-containing protein [Desulfovibrio sp.]